MIADTILPGNSLDTLKTLPDKSVDCCVTSPPYYMLRNYGGNEGLIGLEKTPSEYITNLISIFRQVYRVLKDEGTLWVNIGDSYGRGNSNNSKSMTGLPFRFALAMIDSGWILRQDIIWAKPSCMPESVKDRFCRSHEYLFFFVKQPRYYFNHSAALEPAIGYDGRKDTRYKIADYDKSVFGTKKMSRERGSQRGYASKEGHQDLIGQPPQYHGNAIHSQFFDKTGIPLRTKRDVWTIPTEPSREKHYAMFPQKLVMPCILCGCPENGIVLDPFMGSGTTAIVAKKLMRKYIGCEINPEYIKMEERRLAEINPLFEGRSVYEMEGA
jgi:site-specific DNA-methyltransferase (adenine-specific)